MDLKKTFGIRSISFNSSYMLNHSVWLLVWTAQRAEHTYLISSAKYLDVSYFLTPGVFAIFLQTFFKGIVFKSISFSSFKSISYSFDLEVWFHFERNCPSDLKSSLSHFNHKGHTSVSSYTWRPLTESSVNLCPMTDEQYESYWHRIETQVSCALGVCNHHILEHVLRLHWRFYDMHAHILFRLFRAIKF